MVEGALNIYVSKYFRTKIFPFRYHVNEVVVVVSAQGYISAQAFVYELK